MKRIYPIVLLSFLFLFFRTSFAACSTCALSFCGENIKIEPSTPCSDVQQSGALPLFAKNETCKAAIIDKYCRFFRAVDAFNGQTDCAVPAPLMCQSDCEAVVACMNLPMLDCSKPPHAAPDGSCLFLNASEPGPERNTTNNTLPLVIAPLQCPDLAPPSTPELMRLAELGGFALLDRSQVPFPDIPLVWRPDVPFSSLFPKECTKQRLDQPYHKGYAISLLVYTILFVVGTILFIWRRNYQPVKARSLPIVVGLNVTAYALAVVGWHPMIYGPRSNCSMLIVAGLGLATTLQFFYIVRGFQLWFVFRWAEARLKYKAGESDWFFMNRHLVSRKSFLIALAVQLCLATIFTVAFWVSDETNYGVNKTVLESGRCSWWHFTPEVQQRAAELGISLEPSPFNPNGYAPYSVNYASCKFCHRSVGVVTGINIIVALYSVVIVYYIWQLRDTRDQLYLWKELLPVMVMIFVLQPFLSVANYPTVANSIEDSGVDWMGIAFSIVMYAVQFSSYYFPIILSFSSRFRLQNAKFRHSVIGHSFQSDISQISYMSAPMSYGLDEDMDGDDGESGSNDADAPRGNRVERLGGGAADVVRTSSESAPPLMGTPSGFPPPQAPAPVLPGQLVESQPNGGTTTTTTTTSGGARISVHVHRFDNTTVLSPSNTPALGSLTLTAPAAAQRPGSALPNAPAPEPRPPHKMPLMVHEITLPSGATERVLPDFKIDQLLKDEQGLALAQKLSVEMFCTENVTFYLAAKEYRRSIHRGLKTQAQALAEAEQLRKLYLHPSSPLEVNVSAESHKSVRDAFANDPLLTGREFDKPLAEIRYLLNTNLIPRFVSSKYRGLLRDSLVARGRIMKAPPRRANPNAEAERAVLAPAGGRSAIEMHKTRAKSPAFARPT